MHYYCVPTQKYKIQSYTNLQENIFFTLLVELTNTFEVYQVFRPEVLDKLTKKQMLSWQDFSHLADQILYRIETPSLREWEAFDCYSWMQDCFPDDLLIIKELKIAFYVTCYCFIHMFIEDSIVIAKINSIIKKHNFYLTQDLSKNIRYKVIYAKPRKLSKRQISNLIDKKDYDLLMQFFKLKDEFDSCLKHDNEHPYWNFLKKNTSHFFITLWDHRIKDEQEYSKLIINYFFDSYLLKTQNSLMQQKQLNEDKIFNFVIWLSSQFEGYKIYFEDNDELILHKMTQQDITNNLYMGARLGRGHSLYFPKAKILVDAITEDYCINLIIFDKTTNIQKKIIKMGLYILH